MAQGQMGNPVHLPTVAEPSSPIAIGHAPSAASDERPRQPLATVDDHKGRRALLVGVTRACSAQVVVTRIRLFLFRRRVTCIESLVPRIDTGLLELRDPGTGEVVGLQIEPQPSHIS
jgi:hypothetical protein